MGFIYQKETIAALATPPGEGGIAVIRISGKDATSVANQIFSGNVFSFESHSVHYGKIIDGGKVIDHVLLLVMKNPRSYTGEDTVEIHCHGGSLIAKKVLDVIYRTGARPAHPGEFTYQAFMNGKIDLSQAEAVQEVIASQNELCLQAAQDQLEGRLSQKIRQFQKELVEIAAVVEAWVDFPEEGLEFKTYEELEADFYAVLEKMCALKNTYHDGKILHEGISLCLAGLPNVGKSSLMNALLGKNRAIVTEIAGTTRDLLEESMRINSLHFKLIDTAGIRESDEVVEQEGISRSKKMMSQADLVLFLLDTTRDVLEEEKELLSSLNPEKSIIVWNKIDLSPPRAHLDFPYIVEISAQKELGLTELKEVIEQAVWKEGPPEKGEIIITNARHEQALINAITGGERFLIGLKEGLSPEFLASEVRYMLYELGTIIGIDVTEDILSAIFSKFCVGK